MPGAYPAGPPTLSGDLVTINRLLQNPAAIARRLRSFSDLRFVSDQILTQRFRSTGGAVLYEQTEPFVTDRPAEAVSAGSEYPKANLPTGTAAIAAIAKWGIGIDLTDEEVLRNVYGGAAVDRQLRKVVNSVIKQVDTVALAAVAAAVSATQAAASAWSTIATATPFYDIQNAIASINALNLGYFPDTVLLGDLKYAQLTANAVTTNMLKREDSTNPVYTGKIDTIAGLTIVRSPNLPTADVWVVDSKQLGGMADETDTTPGYTVDTMGVEVKSIRLDLADKWTMNGRRKTVPVVQEVGAGIRITGS